MKRIEIDVHHIDYNKNNNNKDNLISLCISCHVKSNWKRKDWMKYCQRKIVFNL